MNHKPQDLFCLIVGAGISGLLAAHRLHEGGASVTVLEAAPLVGGRMATRQIALSPQAIATFDHGAQYFTVRNAHFRNWVERWQQVGVVRLWSNGFATPRTAAGSGYPRFRGVPDMRAICQHLAEQVDVRLNMPITAIRYDGRWLLEAADTFFSSEALILTPPVPQSLALLDAGHVALPKEARTVLQGIRYDACWAVLAVLDGPSALPEPGGLWPDSDIIAWMADNQQKGISSLPCVTIHGTPAFSNLHFDDDEHEIARLLLQEAQPWLGANVMSYEVERWRYSIPVHVHDEPTLVALTPGPLAFAGDAFAGPRVEGAALSGLAAADALLR